MDLQLGFSIIQLFLAPLIAAIIAVWVGEILRKRNFQKETRLKLLHNLVAYRHKIESDEFLSSLNSLKLFYNDRELNNMVFELRKSFQERDRDGIVDKESNVSIAKIIKKVCELEKFHHITIEDIDNLFKKK